VHVHKYGEWPIGEAPEYASRWAKPYATYGASLGYIASLDQPFSDSVQTIVWPPDQKARMTKAVRTVYSDTIDYELHTPARATLRRSWWPMWKASIDGSAVVTGPDSSGRLILATP